jgi:DtxR family Mn-dependent transcriptional regulator
MVSARPSAVVEDYLQAIYILESEGTAVIGARLAEFLHVSPPTVTEAVQRMSADGLVDHEKRGGIRLTGRGEEVAESVIRRHRLVERLMTETLGLNWAEAHIEAQGLEHALSPRVEEALDEFLGRPTTCPHGNPIPGSGAPRVLPGERLADVTPGVEHEVVRISEEAEEDMELLLYLQRHHMTPGQRLVVREVLPSAGSMSVELGEEGGVEIGVAAAHHVWVHPLDS